MHKFQNLRTWNKSHHLTLDIYQATQSFPKEDCTGLSGQLRRACASISTHIAEVCERGTEAGESGQAITLAMASACEVETDLLLARDCGCVPSDQYGLLNEEVIEIKELLSGWMARQKTGS